MELTLTNARVSWITPGSTEPVDLSQHTTTVTMHLVDPDPPMPETGLLAIRGMLAPIRFTGRTISLTPVGYRMLLGRSHPRIRRMHSAYGQRRGHR